MTDQPTTPASPIAELQAQRTAHVDGVLRQFLAQAVGMTPDRDWEQLIEGAARLAARAEQAEQEAAATATAAAHLTTLMGKRAEQAEADRNRVQQAACRTAESLRKAEQRAEQAEAAAERVRELHQRWYADPGSCAHCENGYGTSLPYPCPTVQALDAQQQPTTKPAHLAKGTNAEDCPACKGTNPPYSFLCPGSEQTTAEAGE